MLRWVFDATWTLPATGTLLLTPLLAVAGPLADNVDGTLVVEVPPYHVGDLILREHQDDWFDEGLSRVAIEVEAPTTVADRYGIDREVYTMRSDKYTVGSDGFDLGDSWRCHVGGSGDNVRIENLNGTTASGRDVHRVFGAAIPGVSDASTWMETAWLSYRFFFDWCGPEPRSIEGVYREGQRLHLREFMDTPFSPDEEFLGELLSEPAKAVAVAGVSALRFRFDSATLDHFGAAWPAGARMILSLLLVDGVPGASDRWHIMVPGEGEFWANGTVVGFEPAPPGAPIIPRLGADPIPQSHPDASLFEPIDRLAMDDAGYGLAFSFADAWQAALRDPLTGLQGFLERHRDAYLAAAEHDVHGRHEDIPSASTEGAWWMAVCNAAADDCHGVHVARLQEGLAPAMDVAKEWPLDDLRGFDPVPLDATPAVIRSDAAHAILRKVVPDLGAIERLQYWVGQPWLRPGGPVGAEVVVSDVSRHDTTPGTRQGLEVHLDLDLGSVGAVRRDEATTAAKPLPFTGNEQEPSITEPGLADVLATPAGIGSSVAASVGALALLLWIGKLLALPLFSRVVRSKLLDSPQRRRIMGAIETEPGIHFRALARAAGLGRGALDHHLRKLASAGLIVVRVGGAHTCYFPRGDVDAPVMEAATLVRGEGPRGALQAVAENPDSTMRQLGDTLHVVPSTVTHHVRRLEAAGLVATRRDGRAVRVRPTRLGRRALEVVR